MLRRANEHESAAFSLVERTLQRTRPRVGARGLEAVVLPHGTIERGLLGKPRLRPDGHPPEWYLANRSTPRGLSEEENRLWDLLRKIVDTASPAVDAEWNLVSMKLGPRVLRRLPMGNLVAYHPEGTPPFESSLAVELSDTEPELNIALPSVDPREPDLLKAIDLFVREPDATPWERSVRLGGSLGTKPGRRPIRFGTSAPLIRGMNRGRRKWHKCPICRRPVVRNSANLRIIHGTIKAGTGTIRDLRGGYLSRLRETYLITDAESVLEADAPGDAALGQPSVGNPR